jgi:hypothetical protein
MKRCQGLAGSQSHPPEGGVDDLGHEDAPYGASLGPEVIGFHDALFESCKTTPT